MAGKATSINETVRATIEQAHKLLGGSSPGAVLEIMQDAEVQLAAKLKELRSGNGKGTWTEASTQATLSQVQSTTAYVKQRLLGLTHEQASEAVRSGFVKTTKLIKGLEKAHSGVARPLPIYQAHRMHEAVSGVSASLLSRHQSSVDRYGANMISEFNRTLRTGLLTGMSNDEMIRALISKAAVQGINAKSLNAAEPRSFPKPTGFVRTRYWAERIVRTERAYAYNRANLETISEFAREDPKARKKIVALMGDPRTAPDSIAVHGQIREVNQNFTDGAGRVYLLPPARPNDRESIIPWHADWKELESTKPPPKPEVDAAVEEATSAAQHKQVSQQEMMALVAAKKAEILERAKQQKSAQSGGTEPKRKRKKVEESARKANASAKAKAKETRKPELVRPKPKPEKAAKPEKKQETEQQRILKEIARKRDEFKARQKAEREEFAKRIEAEKAQAAKEQAEAKAKEVAAKAARAERALPKSGSEIVFSRLSPAQEREYAQIAERSFNSDGKEYRDWIRSKFKEVGFSVHAPNRGVSFHDDGPGGAWAYFGHDDRAFGQDWGRIGALNETRTQMLKEVHEVASGEKPAMAVAKSGFGGLTPNVWAVAKTRTFIHEEVHMSGVAAANSYRGGSAWIEEVTTEMSAQRITHQLFGAPKPKLIETLPGKPDNTNYPSGYGPAIAKTVNEFSRIAGIPVDKAHDLIADAGMMMRVDSDPLRRGYLSHKELFLKHLDATPEQKLDLSLWIERQNLGEDPGRKGK